MPNVALSTMCLTGLLLSGQTGTSPAESKPASGDFVYVCRDAGAGGYQAFPDVCRLSDGRLICVFYAGYGHVSKPNAQLPKGGRISYCTSADEGRTWSQAQTLYDGPDDDRDPSIALHKDGRLLCNFFTGQGVSLVVSEDGGKTWSQPQPVAQGYYCSSPVRQLSGGRLALGLYAESKDKCCGAVTFSDDAGKTWSAPMDIDNGGVRLDAETDVIALQDKTLYAIQRPTMAFSVSQDGGKTWSVSKAVGFAGHCPYLHLKAET